MHSLITIVLWSITPKLPDSQIHILITIVMRSITPKLHVSQMHILITIVMWSITPTMPVSQIPILITFSNSRASRKDCQPLVHHTRLMPVASWFSNSSASSQTVAQASASISLSPAVLIVAISCLQQKATAALLFACRFCSGGVRFLTNFGVNELKLNVNFVVRRNNLWSYIYISWTTMSDATLAVSCKSLPHPFFTE